MDPAAETLSRAELGLEDDAPFPLHLVPAAREGPIVLGFPHVGLHWPAELGPVPALELGRFADFEVHTLFQRWAPALGACCLLATCSRLVVDLNRPRQELPRATTRSAVDGDLRGAIWARAGGVPLLDPGIGPDELQHRLARYYDPYHRAVGLLLSRRRARFGYAILVDAHSMPGTVGVDLCLGTRGGSTCSAEIAQTAFAALQAGAGRLRVSRDRPYAGGEVVRRFGRPATGIHALQLEVNRALYMDEAELRLHPAPGPAVPAADPPSPDPASASVLTPADAEAVPSARAPATTFGRIEANPASPLENRLRHLLSCLLVGCEP